MMPSLAIIPLLVSGGAAIDYERGVNAGTILRASHHRWVGQFDGFQIWHQS